MHKKSTKKSMPPAKDELKIKQVPSARNPLEVETFERSSMVRSIDEHSALSLEHLAKNVSPHLASADGS